MQCTIIKASGRGVLIKFDIITSDMACIPHLGIIEHLRPGGLM